MLGRVPPVLHSLNAMLQLASSCFLTGLYSSTQKKIEGPGTVLGIELRSVLLQAWLPEQKFDCISSLLTEWLLKKHCKHKELESLVSNLIQFNFNLNSHKH